MERVGGSSERQGRDEVDVALVGVVRTAPGEHLAEPRAARRFRAAHCFRAAITTAARLHERYALHSDVSPARILFRGAGARK